MWPWEHLAVGYLCYSTFVHLRTGNPPSGSAALVVVFATQFPDLVDKPLSWTFAIVPGGYSIGHSVFVAIPTSLIAFSIARRVGRPAIGAAFAIGYLSHLPGDLAYIYATNGYLATEIFLWPVAPLPSGSSGTGLTEHFVSFFRRYVATVSSGQLIGFVILEGVLGVISFGLWIFDGAPGVRTLGWLFDRLFGWTTRSS